MLHSFFYVPFYITLRTIAAIVSQWTAKAETVFIFIYFSFVNIIFEEKMPPNYLRIFCFSLCCCFYITLIEFEFGFWTWGQGKTFGTWTCVQKIIIAAAQHHTTEYLHICTHTHLHIRTNKKQVAGWETDSSEWKEEDRSEGDWEWARSNLAFVKVNTWPFVDQEVIVLTAPHKPVCC